MYRHFPACRVSLCLLGVFLLGLVTGLVRSQDVKQLGAKTEIENKFNEKKKAFNELVAGTRQPAKADADIIDNAAKYFAYRVTWVASGSDSASMQKGIQEYEELITRMLQPGAAKNNQEFKKQFGKQLAARFKEVFDLDFSDNRLACVNAALMLPSLAKTKDEEVGDFFTKLVANPKTAEPVRLYALKGMGEFFPPRVPGLYDEPKDAKILKKRERDVNRVKALLEFIDRKWDETQVEPAAASYIRREAVKALADVQVPAVFVQKDKKGIVGVQGPAALGLLKVLANDGLAPEVAPTEKFEAAIGVCHLRAGAFPDYQPDLGVYLTGKALADFVDLYLKDLSFIRTKTGKSLSYVPYKIYAERFLQGLDAMAKNSKGTPVQAKADRLQEEGRRFLKRIRLYDDINEGTANFRQTVETFRPKTTEIFKGLPEPKVNLGK
jgi:ribosomal protein S17E